MNVLLKLRQLFSNHTTLLSLALSAFKVLVLTLLLLNLSLNQTLLIFLLYMRQTLNNQLISLSGVVFLDLKRFSDSSYAWSCSSCKGETSVYSDIFLKNAEDSSLYFKLTSLSVLVLFPYQSPSSSACKSFDTVSSKIEMILSINLSSKMYLSLETLTSIIRTG